MNIDFDRLRSNLKSNKYTLIGSGSCRVVYDLGNGYVVKAAKDIRGILQNQAEKDTYNSRKSDFFAEITSVSENCKYLIMIKAKKVVSIRTVLSYYKVGNLRQLMLIPAFAEDIKANNIGSGDLKRTSSWGIVNNVPVLIDYGLNRSIYNKYYKNQRFFRKSFKRLGYSS
jgi:hypothetical protein